MPVDPDKLDLLPRHLLKIDTRVSNMIETSFLAGPVDDPTDARQYKFFVPENTQYIGTL